MPPSDASVVRRDYFARFGIVVLVIAAARAFSGWVMPPIDGGARGDQVFAATFLMVGHAALYWFHAQFRAAKGSAVYFGMQATLAAAIALFSLSPRLATLLLGAVLAQTVVALRAAFLRRR